MKDAGIQFVRGNTNVHIVSCGDMKKLQEEMGTKSMEILKIVIPKWNIAEITGYDPMTTFWQDFSMADKFGNEAIADTYRKVKAEWKDNYKHWTELCLVLNHKIWQWHERDNQKATLYDRRMARRAAGVLLSNNGLKQSVGRCEVSPL